LTQRALEGAEVGIAMVIGQMVHLHEDVLLDHAQLTTADLVWQTLQGFPKGTSGCIGIQADGFQTGGAPFSEVIVVSCGISSC
jgi:hypothetical protein